MQYKAHIPAGIAFASLAMLVSGSPLDLLMLVGGAIGGALPDIDVEGSDGQGSAIQSLGSKTNMAMRKTVVLSPVAKVLSPVTTVLDKIVLTPICKLWRLIATKALGPAYRSIARSGLGRALRLDRDDPSAHRGGLTHSFFSMILFSLPILPLCLLAGIPQLWAGIMWGMLSHLVCDAFCKSGVKFFWPWVPDIGFRNEDGVGGRDGIKLLPARCLMKTGKCTNKAELERRRGSRDYPMLRKYYRLEKGWQRVFLVLAIVLPVLVLTGIGPASGTVAFAGKVHDVAGKKTAIERQGAADPSMPVEDQANAESAQVAKAEAADPNVTTASEAARTDGGRNQRVDEHKGPGSLTYGDIDANTLPVGIVKMPDESLWVAGVGPVTAETLGNLPLTDEEKARLLAAAKWERRQDLPSSVANAVNGVQESANNVMGDAQKVAENASKTGLGGLLDSGSSKTGHGNGLILPDYNGSFSLDGSGSSSNGNGGDMGNGLLGDMANKPLGDQGDALGFNGLTPFTPSS